MDLTATISDADYRMFSRAGFWYSIVTAAWALLFLKLYIRLILLKLASYQWYKWPCHKYWKLYIWQFHFHHSLESHWDKRSDAKCASMASLVVSGLVRTALAIFAEVLLEIHPVPVTWRLQMSRRTRLSVIVKAISQLVFRKGQDISSSPSGYDRCLRSSHEVIRRSGTHLSTTNKYSDEHRKLPKLTDTRAMIINDAVARNEFEPHNRLALRQTNSNKGLKTKFSTSSF
ncbi:uncharacterized protein BCR38DRAFT_406078 [Pseudomassariella vexata]|uniref:Uncharacterized protein n=1 Tax=Pseudomassariella vexata TaxID=1141098 RepID=A0A1Y2EI53_9PEZI|nr:uncharacterized protein BCR38DRAFT_406078 [Pseudomassariella vexata]ORY70475.1 hypothetical protein BCR38DRAFT_406078 [Pseudomassariella vexata]